MKKMSPTTRRAKRTAQARAAPSLTADLREERLARHRPPQESFHQIPRRLLASSAQDHLPEPPPRLLVHDVRAESGDQVEGDHLGPHVAVVAGGVAAGDVLERAGEGCLLDVAH